MTMEWIAVVLVAVLLIIGESRRWAITAKMAGLVITFALIALAGCTSRPQLRVPETIYVDRPIPCLPQDVIPPRPALRTEAELLALDRYRRTHAVWAERLGLSAYAAALEAVVRGCTAP